MSFVDPLWEFVLEDYEEDESTQHAESKRSKKKRDKDSGGEWSWFDGRDENEVSSRRQLKTSTSKRADAKSRSFLPSMSGSRSNKKGNRIEYRDDKEDGFWDVITGAPPAATIPKKSVGKSINKSTKSRSLTPQKSASELSTTSPVVRTQSNLSAKSYSSAKSETSTNEKKKNRFKKRFKWNQSSKNSDDTSMKDYSARSLGVRHTRLTNDRDYSNNHERSQKSSSRKSSSRQDDDSGFDAVDLLFHIADSLDPWSTEASEASSATIDDSYYGNDTVDDDENDSSVMTGRYTDGFSETSGSQIRSKSTRRSSRQTSNRRRPEKLESLLDQPLPSVTAVEPNRYPYHSNQHVKEDNGVSTEIRLRVNPGGNTLSEEVYRMRNNVREDWEEERSARPSFDGTESTTGSTSLLRRNRSFDRSSKHAITRKASFDWTSKGIIASNAIGERRKPTSEKMRVPMSVCITKATESGMGSTQKSGVLKKAMCGMKKGGGNDDVNHLNKSEAIEVFPSSRVIIDGETHLIVGPESDPMTGAMGMPSNHILQSKGPQSVFAYDYNTFENMDVCYTKTNNDPRSSISVRKLGTPPPLLSSPGAENIVVQVEASTVSETDCIIRQGLWWGSYRPTSPTTPGIDVVGKVYSTKQTTGKTYKVKPMDTVLSLVKWGGNSRFMSIHPNKLVKVPDGLDPAQVVCLPECYLSAFQVLHIGQGGNIRYRENSLKGKSILILGSMTNNMGKAMIELALHAGVANIYATAKKKHWKTLISYGVMPLSTDPMEWMQRVAGSMDLVLAPNGNLREDVSPVHFRALVPKYGQLVISGRRIVGNDIPITDWKKELQTPTLSCGKSKALQKILRNSISYDVHESWEKNLNLCKKDLSHLLTLLKRNTIRPEVLDRIPLNKVAKAQELLEKKRLPGFLVCEPWMKSKKRAVYL